MRMKTMTTRTYSELITLPTFEERYEYLKLKGKVGEETFGYDRWMNQIFYNSREWKKFRRDIIVRDMGCDLGIEDREIQGPVIVHHIEPIPKYAIENRIMDILMNPENSICASHNTHNAIHYGDESLLIATTPIERKPYDTCPWKKN